MDSLRFRFLYCGLLTSDENYPRLNQVLQQAYLLVGGITFTLVVLLAGKRGT
jgi:hypothetical protein